MFDRADISFLISTVREAGDTARDIQREAVRVSRKKDMSIVTQADLVVQEFLVGKIADRFPGALFIHEEGFAGSDGAVDDDALYVIIDPIDGTAMYSMYLPDWCVSVGVFRGFRPVYGFVYSPGCGMLFHNDDDHAYLNGDVRRVKHDIPVDSETNIFSASEAHRHFFIDFPGKVRNIGSTALQACLVVDNGRNRTLAFIGRSRLWDWAGAIPIVLKSGASVRFVDGREISYRDVINDDCVFPEYLLSFAGMDFEMIRKYFIRR